MVRPIYGNGRPLYEALKAEGYTLPDKCGDVTLVMSVDEIYKLHFVVYVDAETLAKIGRALVRVAGSTSKE